MKSAEETSRLLYSQLYGEAQQGDEAAHDIGLIAAAIAERDAEIERWRMNAYTMQGRYDDQVNACTDAESDCAALREALEYCRAYDRSPEPEYGESVRGHTPGAGQRFKTPRERARDELATKDAGAALLARLQAHEDAVRVLDEALFGILSNVGLDWYVDQCRRDTAPQAGDSGSISRIHNADVTRRAAQMFENAKRARAQAAELLK